MCIATECDAARTIIDTFTAGVLTINKPVFVLFSFRHLFKRRNNDDTLKKTLLLIYKTVGRISLGGA